MPPSPKQLIGTILSLAVLLGLGLFSLRSWFAHPILFASLESKNAELDTVYNKVRMIAGWNQDTWLMRQSHHGKAFAESEWDRLAIVVHKSSSVAKFYQLASGDEADVSKWTPLPFKIRCHLCHANGPRAIRPDTNALALSIADQLKIQMLNLRIKTYGSVKGVAGFETNDGERFQSSNRVLQKELDLESCKTCHRSGGLRSELTYENIETASFLVEQGAMPPFPFTISQEDWRHFSQAGITR